MDENSKQKQYLSYVNIQDFNSTTKQVGDQTCSYHKDLATHQHFYFGYAQIYHIISKIIENRKQYSVMISNFHPCTCIDSLSMMIGSLGSHGKWVHCKHLNYVLENVMLCELMEMFIHHLIWSRDKVFKLTSCRTPLARKEI